MVFSRWRSENADRKVTSLNRMDSLLISLLLVTGGAVNVREKVPIPSSVTDFPLERYLTIRSSNNCNIPAIIAFEKPDIAEAASRNSSFFTVSLGTNRGYNSCLLFFKPCPGFLRICRMLAFCNRFIMFAFFLISSGTFIPFSTTN